MWDFCRALFLAAFAAAVAAAQQGTPSGQSVRSSSNQTSTARCDDVTELDFKNLTVGTSRRTFAFHNGIAANYDGSLGQDTEHSRPDWKAEIEKDSVIQPAPDVVVRFLVINDSHQTGSGWRYYVTGLRCSSGKLLEVFHRDGMSLRVDRLDSTAIGISFDVAPGEPTRHLSYTWDRNSSKYVLSPAPALLR